MSVEAGQDRQPRSGPSFQVILGTVIALLGGGGKLVSSYLMDESSRIPVHFGELDVVLNQFELHWLSNIVIVIGALFVFTAPRRS